MKNKLIAIIVCASVALTGCTNVTSEEKAAPAPKSRFFTREFFDGESAERFKIIVDRETGVNYLVQKEGYGREATMGMCVLLDAEGKPVITEVENVSEGN